METIDQLYLARMAAESIEQDAWEATRAKPHDPELEARHRTAKREAEIAHARYLDALVAAEADRGERHLSAV